MQSPISFLVELVLDCDLPDEAKKRCRKYIKELTDSTNDSSVYTSKKPVKTTIMQAPSTQRLMQQHDLDGHGTVPMNPTPALPPPTARIVGGEIQTGNGTRGPRKF